VAETSDSNRFGFISDICILSKYRGKRIANQLLEAIIAHFDSVGIRRVRVGVLAANRFARLAHERAGFQPYEMIYEKTIAWSDNFVCSSASALDDLLFLGHRRCPFETPRPGAANLGFRLSYETNCQIKS
jgi:ribosomal protein S18 acetylase RimI-like enzyme